MVITCPSCRAKYKLPGRKLEGRGAKITCPRCSHVFVIFNKNREDEPAAAAPAPAESTDSAVSVSTDALQPASRRVTPPGPAAPTPVQGEAAGEVRARLPGGLRAEDIFNTDFHSIDGDDDDDGPEMVSAEPPGAPPGPTFGAPPATPAPARTPAPAPPEGGAAPPSPTHEIAATVGRPAGERSRPEDVPSGPHSVVFDGPGGEDSPVESLDFRSLGVGTWKVKVAIGLTYDFSDIATLKRSIRDKKVSYEDQISHDGKSWAPIRSDAELDRYFRDVHVQLSTEPDDAAAAKAAAAPAAGGEEPAAGEAAAPATASNLSGSMPALKKPGTDGAGDALKVDLGAGRRRRRRRRKGKKAEKASGSSLPVSPAVIAVVAGILLVVGFFVIRGMTRGGGSGAVTSDDGTDAALEAEAARIREETRARLDREQQEVLDRARAEDDDAGEAVADGDAPAADGFAHRVGGEPIDRDRLEPITPAEAVSPPPQRDTPPERDTPPPQRDTPPERDTPPPQRDTPPPADTGTGDDESGEGEATAEDWALLGDMAGDCGTAVGHFTRAVGMAPGNASYNYKLGRAHHQCGNDSSALTYLKKAGTPAAQSLIAEIEGTGGE